MQGEHHQDSPARSLKRPAPPESSYTSSPPHNHQPAASTSADAYTAPTAAGSNGQPAKKKITRRRQVLSCRNCTVRDGCAAHRADLERRIMALEAAARSGSVSNEGEPPLRPAYVDGPDSETEDAAMTLEDIAVNVRVANPAARRSTAPTTPYLGTAQPLPAAAATSPERASLLVPEISKRFRGVLTDLYNSLPSQPKMDWLVTHYFNSLSWYWVAHHAPTFLAEYDAFRHLVAEGRQLETLAHSANSLEYPGPTSDFTADELNAMIPTFFEAARAALDCGDAFGTPRIRTVQAIVLLGPLALNSGDPGRVDVLTPYVAATVRVCQHLGLDRLGSDPTKMPMSDPALRCGSNTLRRETALRLFHGLLHLDQVIFRVRPVLPLHLVDCAFPGNFDDRDLRGDAIVPPQPHSVRTIASYEVVRFKTGAIQRQYHEQVVLDPEYEYATVLKHDADLRNLIDEYELERPEANESISMFWARLFALQNVQIRRIRVNRPFMSRGYREPALRKSTDAALEAARAVLETQKELDRTRAPLVKESYQINHIQVAVIVLFCGIWHQEDASPNAPSADYRLISDASLCFHRALGSIRERVRIVARQSLLVVQCLFEALHARSATGRREHFAQLLKRVSVAVTETERRAAIQPAQNGTQPHASVPYSGQVALPAPDPIIGDGRSLVHDAPHPAPYNPNMAVPHFPSAASTGSATSFSPHEVQFGDLTSDWGIEVDPARELGQRQTAALEELRLFRTTLDSLKARLPAIEFFIANSNLKDEDSAELDAIVKTFGDPVTELTGSREPLASTSTAPIGSEPPTKRTRLLPPKQEPDEGEAGVEASVNLEFFALGRPRVWTESNVAAAPSNEDDGLSSPSHRLAILPPEGQPESPVSMFPNGQALFDAAPTPDQEDIVFHQGLERYGFHHAVVHAPTFWSHLAAFRNLGDDRFERASLAWLSLYFALLAVSAKLVDREQQDAMGWTEAETSGAASRWFTCSIACLYRHNFLQLHDFSCLQAIAVLVLSGRDAGSATLIASLLSAGLSIAQDMGLQRLPSDEQWKEAMKGKPAGVRAKALIDREIRKRVVWALVHSEWFAIPFKGYSLLSRAQIVTPLPLNATNEDLATGELVNRPRDEYTDASWLLQYVEIGSHMANAFESTRSEKTTASQAYQRFIDEDKQLEGMLANLPAWLRPGGPTTGMPDCADIMRSTYRIALQHKILSIHRPFLAKPSRATTHTFSRRRVIESARAILREAPACRNVRIWTVIYHISVASFSLTLELYEQLKNPTADNEAIRNEIHQALPTLEGLKAASAIAERGLGLVLPLLADEKRLREEGAGRKERRKVSMAGKGVAPTTPMGPAATSRNGIESTLDSAATTTPFAASASPTSPFTALPDTNGTGSPFGHASDPSTFPFPSPSAFDAPAGGMPPQGYPYPVPPWFYGEHYLYSHLSTLDGAPGGAGPSASMPQMSSGAPYSSFPGMAGLGLGGGAGMATSGGAGIGGGPSGWALPPLPPAAFGSALGWDWSSLGGAGGGPGSAGGQAGEGSPAGSGREGDGL
ncbi:Proteophosphoglycan ppg4 [Rhodotorula toruloides]